MEGFMYSSINLIVYSEKGCVYRNDILTSIINTNIRFKELHSITLLFSAIKNPNNLIVIAVNTKEFLITIEKVAKLVYNYQNRVFIIFSSPALIDFFFENYCLISDMNKLEQFIVSNSHNLFTEYKKSQLLNKLITLELTKIDLSPKYVGFEYLVTILSNIFTNNFHHSSYIELFECVAYNNSHTIDTIERNIRHMLSTTWKNSDIFKTCLKSTTPKLTRPSARTILDALIIYIKNVI